MHLQDDIVSIQTWCDNNHLKLNIQKCFVISYSKGRHIIHFDYKIGSDILKRLNEISDLGVLFDSGLSFGPRISRMVSSANRMLGFIIRNGRDFSDLNVIEILYTSYVRYKIESNSLIWYPIYADHNHKRN
nr:unnamed protein product [Callosobruchus chinensis]